MRRNGSMKQEGDGGTYNPNAVLWRDAERDLIFASSVGGISGVVVLGLVDDVREAKECIIPLIPNYVPSRKDGNHIRYFIERLSIDDEGILSVGFFEQKGVNVKMSIALGRFCGPWAAK